MYICTFGFTYQHHDKYPPDAPLSLKKKSGSTHKNFPCNSRVPSRVWFLLVPLCTPSTLKDVVTLSATHNNHHHHHHHLSLPLLSLSTHPFQFCTNSINIFIRGYIYR